MEARKNESRQDPVEAGHAATTKQEGTIVIPVIEERMTISREMVETAKVRVRKTVTEEEATLDLPLVQEHYDVERVPVKEVYRTAPGVRQEGDTIIVPVVREVLVIEKRYEVIEEVRLTRKTTAMPYLQQIPLQREHVEVTRTSPDGKTQRL